MIGLKKRCHFDPSLWARFSDAMTSSAVTGEPSGEFGVAQLEDEFCAVRICGPGFGQPRLQPDAVLGRPDQLIVDQQLRPDRAVVAAGDRIERTGIGIDPETEDIGARPGGDRCTPANSIPKNTALRLLRINNLLTKGVKLDMSAGRASSPARDQISDALHKEVNCLAMTFFHPDDAITAIGSALGLDHPRR